MLLIATLSVIDDRWQGIWPFSFVFVVDVIVSSAKKTFFSQKISSSRGQFLQQSPQNKKPIAQKCPKVEPGHYSCCFVKFDALCPDKRFRRSEKGDTGFWLSHEKSVV